MAKRRVHFRIDEARYELLVTTAHERGVSIASVVDSLVDEFLPPRGTRTLDELDLDRALTAAADAVTAGDARTEASNLVQLATGLQHADRHDEAIDVFRDVLARTGDEGFDEYEHVAWQHMGECLVEMGRVPEAVAAFHRALAIRILLDDPGLVAASRRALDAASGRSMVRVGVGAVVRRADGALLLVHRRGVHGDGTWSTPGGHLDFGESPEDCAVREAAEETGVSTANPRVVATTNDVMVDDGRHYVTIWVLLDHVDGDGEALATHELDEVRWFARDDLPSPRFSPLDAALATGAF